MLTLFIYSCLVVIISIPFSELFITDKQNNFYSYSKKLIFSVLFLSFLGLILNFLTALNIYVTSSVTILNLILFYKYKKNYFNLKFFTFVCFQGLFISILILESNVYRPDAGLYHLPFIGILNSEKIIIGMSNLHIRYGLTSILQYFSAINNNLIFKDNGIVFAQAIIASTVILNFLSLILKYNESKNYNFHYFFLIFILIYISYKMNRYSEYGNDAPAHFLFFFLISEILLFRKKFNNDEYLNQITLTFFIITNKLTLIPILLFNLINIKKIKWKDFFLHKKFKILILISLLWLIKNIFITGCLIYPIKNLCIEKLPWANIDTTEKVSISAEAWTKGISDIDNKNIDEKTFIKKFNWINAWLSKHFKLIVNILYPYIIFIVILGILFKIKSIEYSKKNIPELTFLLTVSLITIIVWFYKAPLYRYGYSQIIVFVSLISAAIFANFKLKEYILSRFTGIIIILCISVFSIKNVNRIIKTDNNSFNYPWPKYYSMRSSNSLEKYNFKEIDNVEVYYPIDGGYCMYLKKICAHYQSDINQLLIEKKFKYLFVKKIFDNN
tara:strand:+ start:10215 stop:11885 length:1671 start_codon:yes stop_codon:yes gene_type:complete